VVVKGKKMNKSLTYIEELPAVMKDLNGKCLATSPEFFTNVENLVNLIKRSAQLSIANCLSLYASPKYKEFNNWEKFNQTFQMDLVRMANQHSYYMAVKFALQQIKNLSVEIQKETVGQLNSMLRLFCLSTILKQCAPLATTQFLTA